MFDDHTSASIDAARRRIHDIGTFQIPRLRKCESSLADQSQLAAEMREDMDNVSRLVEELAVAIGDQQGEKTRAELERIVNEMRDTLVQLRKDIRVALLSSKKAIDSRNARAVREELFTSSAVKEKHSLNEKATDDILMEANDDVTESLRRTIALMQGELERSVLASQILGDSTAVLRATSQTHDTLGSLIVTSKHLITALEKSDWLDRIVILSAFMFFITVVLFILKQRFIDRGLRLAFWWTRFIPLPNFNNRAANVLKVVEEGSASMSVSVATAASTLSSVSASVITITGSSATASSSSSVTIVPELIASDSGLLPTYVPPTPEPEPLHVEL